MGFDTIVPDHCLSFYFCQLKLYFHSFFSKAPDTQLTANREDNFE